MTAFFITAIFSACKKDASMNAAPDIAANTNSQGAGETAANPVVSYVLSPQLSPNSVIQWNSGYLTLRTIYFQGGMQEGNAMVLKNYSEMVNRQVTFLPTPTGGALLGSVSVLGGTYYGPVFGLNVQPISPAPNSVISAQNINPSQALQLSGTFYNTAGKNSSINVTLIVNQLFAMTANGPDPLKMLPSQQNYISTLSLDLTEILTGITPEMINSADMSDNNVVISESSNINLYGIIFKNLQNALKANLSPVAPGNLVNLNNQPGATGAKQATVISN